MRLSQTAREYELKHGLVLDGTLYHGGVETKLKYGELTNNKNKTTVIHGYTGAQNIVEIETVRSVVVEVGDKVQLVDGRKGKVTNAAVELIEERQLLFVPYTKADKATRITIQFI